MAAAVAVEVADAATAIMATPSVPAPSGAAALQRVLTFLFAFCQ